MTLNKGAYDFEGVSDAQRPAEQVSECTIVSEEDKEVEASMDNLEKKAPEPYTERSLKLSKHIVNGLRKDI